MRILKTLADNTKFLVNPNKTLEGERKIQQILYKITEITGNYNQTEFFHTTTILLTKKVKVKECISVNGFQSHRCGTSLAIWDHTVLPATRHE